MDSTSSPNQNYLNIAIDIAVRLAVIFLFVFACIRIFTPFIVPVVWGGIIAIALLPLFEKLDKALGGRRKLAGGLFILISLVLVLVPTYLLTDSLLDGTVRLVEGAKEGTLEVPPPTAKVQTWPLIGPKVYTWWDSASRDLDGTLEKLQPQIGNFGQAVARAVGGLGGAVVQSIFALIIAGILMMHHEGTAHAMHRFAKRLAGPNGKEIAQMAVGSVRSVVKGVILVALIQGLMSALGMWFAGVPAMGLWALLVVILAVVQLPPILILGPIIVWVFANNDSTVVSVIFLIWTLIISVSDGFLKPLLLGRGVDVPMLVILIGAIGGLIRAGVIGLFVGPVVLVIGYTLFKAWIADTPEGESPSEGTAT